MFPKKTLLAVVIAVTVASCGDSNGGAKQAENAEARVRDYVAKISESYSVSLATSDAGSVKGEVTDYQRGEQQSSAKGKFVFNLNPTIFGENSLITANFTDSINHDDKLLKDKVVAIVDSKYNLQATGLEKMDEVIHDVSLPLMIKAVDNTTTQTTFKENNEIVQSLTVNPFEYRVDEQDLQQQTIFKILGIHSQSEFNQADLANPFLAIKGTVDIKGLTISNEDKQLELKPFTVTYQQDGKGNLDSKTSAIDFVASNFRFEGHKLTVHTDNVEMNGKGMSVDKTSNLLLGQFAIKLNQFIINDGSKQITFNTAEMGQNVQKQNDLYSIRSYFDIAPETDLVLNTTGIPNLKINNFSSNFTMNNLSKSALIDVKAIQQAAGEQDKEKAEAIAENLFVELADKKANINLEMAVDTQQGKATLQAQAKFVDNVDTAQLKSVVESKDEEQILAFLQNNVEADADVVVPEALVNATGMGAMVEQMAGAFVKKTNDNYTAHIEYKAGKLTVNGIPLL